MRITLDLTDAQRTIIYRRLEADLVAMQRQIETINRTRPEVLAILDQLRQQPPTGDA